MNFSSYQNLRDLFTVLGNKFLHRPEAVEISQADYNLLTPAQKADKTKIYYIYDASGGGGASDAKDVAYDNSESGLSATNVQDAIDAKANDFVEIDYEDWGELTDEQKEAHNWKVTNVPDVGPTPPTPDVPDGKTVTPVNDVEIWLECAGLTDTGYTTLTQVLNDTGVLSVLMADSNAVDYLVRSTTFAKSEALVPTMTSDNTPSGVCIASTVLSGYNAYKAFDGDNTSAWIPNNNATNNYVGYEFTLAQRVEKVTATIMRGNWGGSVPSRTFKVQGYSDDWHDIGTITTEATNTTSTDNYTATITTSGLYTKCRLFCEDIIHSEDQYDVRIMELQFYNVAVGVTDNSTAMSYIGLNNYCANTLLADSTWCNAICNSTYFESVLNAKVPNMTSNTAPSGTVIYNAQIADQPAYMAFNSTNSPDNHTKWMSGSGNQSGDWIGYDFVEPVRITKIMLHNRITGTVASPSSFILQSSDDNTNWDNIKSFSNSNNNADAVTYYKTLNLDTHRYYRIYITGTYNNSSPIIVQLQFWGRKDVV